MRKLLLSLCLIAGFGLAVNSAAVAKPKPPPPTPLVTASGTIDFGRVVVDTTSTFVWAEFTNNSSEEIAWTQMSILAKDGSYSADFTWVDAFSPQWNTCGNLGTVAPGATCHMGLYFTPTTLGRIKGATLSVNWWGVSSWKVVATSTTKLTGIGQPAPDITP